MLRSVPILWLLALLLAAPTASAQTCSEVTFDREYLPLGTCRFSSSTQCTSDGQCNSGSKDFCVKGVCENNPSQFCTSNSNCGGSRCVDDITFRFDKPYTCGQFVNGDWWVAADSNGSVRVTGMTPAHTSGCESGSESCRNGWGIDMLTLQAPFTGRAFGVPSHSPSLPRTFSGVNQPVSLIKGIDGGASNCDYPSGSYCSAVLQAAVLTIVPRTQLPPADAFRPAASGPDKQSGYYRASQVDLGKMPAISKSQLPSGAGTPSMDSVRQQHTGPFIGINRVNAETYGLITHNQGPHAYHAERAKTSNRNLLRLTLNDADYANNQAHRDALMRAIQTGIDKSWTLRNWARHGTPKRRIKDMAVPIMFAAHMLGDASLANTGYPNMSEQDTFFDSPRYGPGHAGDFMWGYGCTEDTYWKRTSKNKASDKWCGDPYGYAEGTLLPNGGSYMQCCSMGPWKGGALFVHLMKMQHILDVRGFLHVMGRYWDGWASDPNFEQGHWAAGDVCSASGSPTRSPSSNCWATRSCTCQAGGGRNTSIHNQLSNYGDSPGVPGYQDGFANTMWDTFRHCADTKQGNGATSSTYPCAGMVGGAAAPDPEPDPDPDPDPGPVTIQTPVWR